MMQWLKSSWVDTAAFALRAPGDGIAGEEEGSPSRAAQWATCSLLHERWPSRSRGRDRSDSAAAVVGEEVDLGQKTALRS